MESTVLVRCSCVRKEVDEGKASRAEIKAIVLEQRPGVHKHTTHRCMEKVKDYTRQASLAISLPILIICRQHHQPASPTIDRSHPWHARPRCPIKLPLPEYTTHGPYMVVRQDFT